MAPITTEYVSVGGNRHPAAADWDARSGILAFGADNNVALWDPGDKYHTGIYALLPGHTDKVNAVKFYTCPSSGTRLLLTGSVDRTIRIWSPTASSPPSFTHVATLQGHENSINCLAVVEGSDVFVSGAADGTVRVWRVTVADNGNGNGNGGVEGKLLETITVKPRLFPLALALRTLPAEGEDASATRPMMLAVGGTKNTIQIYVSQDVRRCQEEVPAQFEFKASLTGHEAWIRSLAFTNYSNQQPPSQDFFLASASQDKYIRLWRVHAGESAPAARPNADESLLGTLEQTLSNKAYEFRAGGSKYSLTFEALLFGHEDWIYTIAWNADAEHPKLLSASADNSLVIWEPDPVSGVWFSAARMGEISAQKGSTTATGSIGGFWIGLWSPCGGRVVSLGRTGSWRSWTYDAESDIWNQNVAVSGHVRSVNGIQWEPSGGYLLSTSSDQTTRLHAKWKQNGHSSWHEFSRPQIHGYDLNCIASLGPSRFVSGADEKLLRVFNETKAIASLLENLSGFTQSQPASMPEAANIPVLGLSNKAVDENENDDEEPGPINSTTSTEPTHTISAAASALSLPHPPLEDHLSKFTLWPEHEKLYGHGYEISAVAASHDGTLIATACKASSLDHAVIRLYDATGSWHEIRPPLTAHSLTITCLRFSGDDRYLLSGGRDRQWALWRRDERDGELFRKVAGELRGHARMILCCAWAPVGLEKRVFATAGRDKVVKVWMQGVKVDGDKEGEERFVCQATIPISHPVSAIEFLPEIVNGKVFLAVGEDNGLISVHPFDAGSLEAAGQAMVFPRLECPSKAVTQLSWRPAPGNMLAAGRDGYELAVASEDSSVRIFRIGSLPPTSS
ncbi:hypothetical protein FQN52_006806 [Onygenales sp. PD_12]|nr:hypothetical protein FQN52_006806 [Onygenales sp. PD_12]